MSGRNIFKFRLQFSGLSVKRYFWKKERSKSDTALLEETQNLNIPFLGSLLREEVDLASSQVQTWISLANLKENVSLWSLHRAGTRVTSPTPLEPKGKKPSRPLMPTHFNLTAARTQECPVGPVQYKTSMKLSKLWLRPGKFSHKVTTHLDFCGLRPIHMSSKYLLVFRSGRLTGSRMISAILK